ncbi:iridoid synthase CYC2-like [Punica granatum]|uniref:Iridoid synthase CYC2-like n=1 Tax=Punica granatum TaxID=22663 RepID=A0A218XTW5_PUNGR|nr:iridoid synthase CYC2-like [Punica granatum]OWM88069.1 hypothetical protein CDL15_Pgr016642 [Punica granatum]
MEQTKAVALVVGVTGMAGLSLVEALKKPEAPGGPWKVYGVARRARPSWLPACGFLDDYISLDATDSKDTHNKLAPISREVTHVFWVALQALDNEEQKTTINSTMLVNVLNVLVTSPSPGASALRHVNLQTGTQHYMGPLHELSALSSHLVPHDPPFREDSPRLPYPNFYYALEDILLSYAPSITYSIHRASIIVDASSRSVYNALLTLAAYAEICRHTGLPFRFPGTQYTWDHFCDVTDARVLAEQHIWAATTDSAKNQAFNCTNGDFFTWKSMWKVLAKSLRVEFVPFEESGEFDFVGLMKDKGKVWDEIVEKHGLYKTKLDEISCSVALSTVLHFTFQHVSSMTKSREFGFFGFTDTFKSIPVWIDRLRKMKIIP